MPIYEYKCQDCGQVTEVLVRSTQPDLEVICHYCQGQNLKKMISSPAAVRMGQPSARGKTCCGKDERCDAPPCSSDGTCRRD
jgi:putative FmdB family regulatory protein